MLSVPLQQLTRTYVFHSGEMETEDVAMLEEVISKEHMLSYVSAWADPVKEGFRQEVWEKDKMAYVSLWIRVGINFPEEYIASFLLNTLDYWYPFGVVDGCNPGVGCDYCDYYVKEPGERIEMLPRVHAIYKGISEDREVSLFPGMFLLLSPGWYLHIFLYVCGYFWVYRKKEFLLPMSLIILLLLTTLLGPVAIVRYVLILYYAFPLWIAFLLDIRNFTITDREPRPCN